MRPGTVRFAPSSSAQRFLATSASIVRHTGPMALRIQSDEFPGVVSCPVGTGDPKGLPVGDQDEHVDELLMAVNSEESSLAEMPLPWLPLSLFCSHCYAHLRFANTGRTCTDHP